MGASSSSLSELSRNEYLGRFVSREVILPDDSFWNNFLSFTFTPPYTSSDYRLLEESVQNLYKSMLVNNLVTGNFTSLLHVFLARAVELKASTQSDNNIFTWQTYNALFILRCLCKYYIETLKEEDVIKQLQAKPPPLVDNPVEEYGNMMELFLSSLVELLVDVPLKNFTYILHLETINTLLVLLSTQMFSPKPAFKSGIYRAIMQEKCSIHACLLMKTLLQNYIRQMKIPPGLQRGAGGGSIVLGLASGLWNILTLGMSSSSGQTSDNEESVCEAPLASQSVLLILVLSNHCTNDKGLHNPYRQAFFSFTNSQDSCDVPTRAVATFKVNFSSLNSTLIQTLTSDQTTLMLYLLLHKNQHVKTYILSRTDIEQLVLPILKTLYHAPESNSHHIYMSLIILLILSEDDLFNKAIHDTALKNITWYTERSISEISLGGLLVLVVIRTIQYNMLKMRDKYLHTNCLAALANMSSQFRSLHPYVSQRIVSLFETLAKKHTRLVEQIRQSGELENCTDEDIASDVLQDLTVLEDVLRMVLEIINSCLSNQLAHNPNLVYTLLYKKHVFEGFQTHPTFQDITQNIDVVITYFANKLEYGHRDLSVHEVLATIQQGALQWPKERLKKFPELKFKYVEENQPEDFFIPYVWSLVYHSSNLYWNSDRIHLFTPDQQET